MKIALIGNQNSGKTTLFNLLTGMNQKIGNWPGVTIEQKIGTIKGSNHTLIDLPGVYSLSPYSKEEEVSRDFILNEQIDLIINIVDATSLERSLYLTTQLLELDIPIIVALNMSDVLTKKGITLHIDSLEKELGAKVILISALRKKGISDLISAAQGTHHISEKKIFDSIIEKAISDVESKLEGRNKRFLAIKLLERDCLLNEDRKYDGSIATLEDEYGTDTEEIFAMGRYNYITALKRNVLTRTPVAETLTRKIDRILLHKWASLLIFAIIMFAIYYLSVGVVGSFTVELLSGWREDVKVGVGSFLKDLNADPWAISLVVDGIIEGVGAILLFIPQLIILFLCISLLETSGYMSRIAFIMDKIFRKLGLSGKTIIPFIVGSGCSVPGIMGTRTIENEEERKLAVVLTPFIPCSAKLPIIATFAGAFFPRYQGFFSAGIYLGSIIVIVFSALVLRKFYVKKSSPSSFISELPEYRLPSPRYVLRDVSEKVLSFFKRAGTIILVCSVAVWFLVSFSWDLTYGVDTKDSILAGIGNTFAWLFYPMLGGNWSWECAVSAIQGLIAKEQVITSMGIIGGLSADAPPSELFASGSIYSFFTTGSAIAFIVFNLFSAPCIAAIGAMRKELGSKKKMFLAMGYQTGLAWLLATLIGLVSMLI